MAEVSSTEMLADELRTRKRRNPAYSVRSFAKDLRLSNAYLSQILSGKRSLSEDRAAHLTDRLAWDEVRKNIFLESVRYRKLRNDSLRSQSLLELKRLGSHMKRDSRVSLDNFSLISTWYHSAILEMTQMKDFHADADWLSARLGITPAQARQALSDLYRAGVIRLINGRWTKQDPNTSVIDTPSHVLRAYHLQLIERTKRAITMHPNTSRRYGGVTMVVDPKRLDEAHKKMRDFRKELMDFLEQGERTAVYHFSTHLFRLDKIDGE